MPQFFVCFTGDAKHHRDDMIKIALAKGAKGVYYTELDRAVYDAQKRIARCSWWWAAATDLPQKSRGRKKLAVA